MNWEARGIELLAASIVRPFVLVTAAWVVLRLFGVRHPASRHAVWAAVLVGMLAVPFVSVMAPHWMVPVLPARQETAIQTIVPEVVSGSPVPQSTKLPGKSAGQRPTLHSPQAFNAQTSWDEALTPRALVMWGYLAGLFAMVAYRFAGWAMLWRVMSRSRRLHGHLLESDDVLAPVAVGLLQPVVILPVGWREWNASMRRAVLAHEFAHLRRRDTLVSALSGWVRCVLWFHPLAWWVSREVSDLAELACDAAALERVGDPVGYSRMLLGFAGAGHRVTLPGLAMAASRGMDRRIDSVFEFSGGNMRKMARPGVWLMLLGIPVVGLAATVGLGVADVIPTLPSVLSAPAVPLELRRLVAQQNAPRPVAPPTARTSASVFEKPVDLPRFEVASVKPCAAGESRGAGSPNPGWLTLHCKTMTELVRDAYVTFADAHVAEPIKRVPTSGGPAWMDSERFTIDAKAEDTPTWGMMDGPMLQVVLEEKFQLKIHREMRDVPVYALTVDPDGLKMQPFKEGSCIPLDLTGPLVGLGSVGGNYCRSRAFLSSPLADRQARGSFITVDAQGMSLEDFSRIYLHLGRPVVDKTGLSGRFDFRLEYTTGLEYAPLSRVAWNAGGGTKRPKPPLVVAMQEQLGLRLGEDVGPQEFLVIDSVERPAGN